MKKQTKKLSAHLFIVCNLLLISFYICNFRENTCWYWKFDYERQESMIFNKTFLAKSNEKTLGAYLKLIHCSVKPVNLNACECWGKSQKRGFWKQNWRIPYIICRQILRVKKRTRTRQNTTKRRYRNRNV